MRVPASVPQVSLQPRPFHTGKPVMEAGISAFGLYESGACPRMKLRPEVGGEDMEIGWDTQGPPALGSRVEAAAGRDGAWSG